MKRLLSLVRLLLILAAASPQMALAQQIVQSFYVPLPSEQIRAHLLAVYSGTGNVLDSVTSIVVTGSGTRIYYDHWEDGYEADLEHPTQPTSQIWGDGNLSNGVAPGYPTDILSVGSVLSLRNLVSLPRNPAQILYDGRDRFGATRALAVSRAAWTTVPGPVIADAVEVISTRDYGTSFRIPVGQNVSANSMFEYTGISVMAAENGTSVSIDSDANGVAETVLTLNQGESFLVNGGVLLGATVTSTKPIQVHLLTGDINANYETRWATVYPLSSWGDSYYTPVGTSSNGNEAYVLLYNPSASSITVSYQTQSGTGSVTVPGSATGGTTQFLMPTNSGGHFYTADGSPFFAMALLGAKPTANNVYDWSFAMVPENMLTTKAVVGWGPGSADGTVNGSPVWVTAVDETILYVDYDGNPGTGALGPDANGDRYDVAVSLSPLESYRIFDPDRDQTGMKIYTLDGILIAAAYGEDPATAAPGNPYLDLGMTVLPLPVPIVTKTARLVLDDGNPVPPGGNGLVDAPNDVLEYQIEVTNGGVLVLGNVIVIDTPAAPLVYMPNSSEVNGVPIPDDTVGATLFPFDEGGYTIPVIYAGETVDLTYNATVQVGATAVHNTVAVNTGDDPIISDTVIPVNNPSVTPCSLAFTDSTGTSVAGYTPGQSIYVTVADGDSNTNPSTQQTMTVLVTNPSTNDAETITLTETGVNTGIFRNTSGLPFSQATGLTVQDGTLHVQPGQTISSSRTDPVYGDFCSDTAVISPQTATKQLYLDTDGSDGDATGDLDRDDPVNNGPDLTTSSTTTLSSGATIALDATSNNNGGGAISNLTVSHTTGSGSERLMLVGVSVEADAGSTVSVSSVTWTVGATVQTLTQVGSTVTSGEANARIYRMIAPTSGAGTVRVNFSNAAAADSMVVGVATFTGVDQTTPLGTFASATGTTSPATVNVTSASGQLVFDTLALDDARTATVGAGQTQLWSAINGVASSDGIRGAGSTEAGAASVTMSWTIANDNWALAAVPIRPGTGTTTATFTQTPVMASNLSLPAGGTIGVVACVNVVSGSMPANPSITATLRRDATTIATLSSPTYSATTAGCNNGPGLTWSSVLPSDVTVTAGQAVILQIVTAQSGVSFQIQYDSSTRPSQVTLPTTTVISVDSLGIYDAPYPGGNLIASTTNGQTVYIRTTVSDPFGNADITSLDLLVEDPVFNAEVNTSLGNAYAVATTAGTKTYEYAWTTGVTSGLHQISVTAHEGYEGTITDTAGTQFTVTSLDLGTPSITEFTTGNNGPGTLTYAANETVCVRVTDIDQNLNPAAAETVTVVVSSSPGGDSETMTLTETGVNTGVFSACIPASATVPGTSNNGTLYAPTGTVLTANYVDPTDATDSSSDTATVPAGVASIAVAKTRLSPAAPDNIANVGESITYRLTATNNGNATLTGVTLADTFNAGCMTYSSSTVAPVNPVANPLVWNIGSLVAGASSSVDVTFTAVAACSAATAQDTGTADSDQTAATNATATVTITGPGVQVTKTRITGSPASVGSTVSYTIDILNSGSSIIESLPLGDSYSTCLAFVSSTPAADGAGGGAIVWNDLVPGASQLAVGATTSVTVNFSVVGECNPALNLAEVAYATDVNNDPVPPAFGSATVVTLAASISGQVRNDTDADGDLGDADAGIAGVVVRLYSDPNGDGDINDGTLIALTATDSSGNYTFSNLSLGSYVVVESDPAGYYSTADTWGINDNRIPVDVALVQTYSGNDFLDSNYQAATVAGRVYEDVNQNGVYDAAIDTTLEGVTVLVTDSLGLVHALTTDISGLFSQAVPPGTATVDVVESTITQVVSPTLTTDASGEGSDPTVLYAAAGGTATDYTGYVASTNVGLVAGTIYEDRNDDGVYTAGVDTPLSGVDVRITDVNGGVYTVTTDASGFFSQTVAAGAATVDVVDSTLPAGASLTVGSTDPTAVVVPNGGMVIDDTGYQMPADFGLVDGTVYLDNDASGTFSVGDTPLANIQIEITDSSGQVYLVTTDGSGYFQQPVPAGNTTVDIVDLTVPPTFTLTTDASGEGSDPTIVLVPAGGVGTDNTGFIQPPALGFVNGTIYVDVNVDGAYTAGVDTPLAGVEVLITDANGGSYVATTNASGYFNQLVAPGVTTIDVVASTLPAGATLTVGSTDPTTVNVPSGGSATDNTGYILPPDMGTVDGTVFLDGNGNGVYDAGIDTPLVNVEVAITDAFGSTYTVTTNASGYFQQPVRAGSTTIDVVDATLPAGVVLTTDASGQGSDPTVVQVPANGTATDNTGYVTAASTGTVQGTVYVDLNGNGAYDAATDTPLSGVEVEITASNGAVYTVVTDADGYFSRSVPSGNTTVDVVNSTLPLGASLTVGSTDPTTVSVPNGGTATDNTGYTLPAGTGLVTGTVYLDNNTNGVYDAGDTALANVQVVVTDVYGNETTVSTDSSGRFEQPVPPGATTVDVVDSTLPVGATLTSNASGQGSDPTVVTVPANGTGTDNTGYRIVSNLGTVQGTIFIDANGNGVYNPGVDTVLAGTQVRITDALGGIYTVTTDTDGYFSQTVPAGSTTVDVVDSTLPAGVTLATGNTDPTTVNVVAGSIATDNTGYLLAAGTGQVNGTVYLDNNGNGIFDAGDTALPNVDVRITDSTGATYVVPTDASGYFERPVPAGNTTVDVVDATLPAGAVLTSNGSGQGTDPTVVVVPANGSVSDLTGYTLTATTGTVQGTIYLDVNNNGVYDAGVDTPLPGVQVTVTASNGAVSVVTTDLNGFYSQTVPAGSTGLDVVNSTLPVGVSLAPGNSDPRTVSVPVNGVATANTGYAGAVPTATPTATATPVLPPDLWLQKSHVGSFQVGSNGLYTITVTNMGAGPTTGTTSVVDTLPTGLSFVSASGSGWSCSAVAQTVTCTRASTIAVGASTSIALTVAVSAPAFPTVTNSATVSTPGDPNPNNNTDSDPTTVRAGSVPTATNTVGPGTPTPAPGTPTAVPPTATPSNPGTITGTVFNDINGNGAQNSNLSEGGIAGVTVQLRDSNGNVIATTTTSASGGYSFTGLTAGAYTVVEIDPSGYTSTTPNSVGVTLSPGNTVTVNFGDQASGSAAGTATPTSAVPTATPTSTPSNPGTITGTVFNDINGNGAQNSNLSELGIAGVTVQLRDSNGNVIATTTTNASGGYTFSGLPAGTYTVVETDPSGYTSTTPNSVGVTLSPGNTVTVNFGDQQVASPTSAPGTPTPTGAVPTATSTPSNPGTITGTVFNDINGNGAQNSNLSENGIADVTVQLRDSNGNVIATTTTNASGGYTFSGLPAGTYTVVETDPSGYTSTTPNSVGVTLSPGNTVTVNFGDQQPATATPAPGSPTPTGVLPTATATPSNPGTITGTVFNDINGNGAQNSNLSENGIAGVTVQLRDSNGNVIATTTTNASGGYTFSGLPAGTYTVVETDPSGYTSTTPNSVGVTLSPGNTVTVNFGDQQPATSTPAPGTPTPTNGVSTPTPTGAVATATATPSNPGTITGTVFNDINGNGAQNSNLSELGIAGVTVQLRDSNGNVIATTTTNASGGYTFSGLPAGTYTVVETDPSGYTSTTPNSVGVTLSPGNTVTVNFGDQQVATSTPAPGTATPTSTSGPGTPIPGTATPTRTATVANPGTITGRVFDDLNENGAFNSNIGEAGIAGVTVQLRDSNGNVVATTTTDANGNYTFNNVPPGVYTVVESDPSGYTSTTPNSVAVTLSPGNTVTVNFGDKHPAGGTPTPTVPAGKGAVAGTVFVDRDGDGIQDAGEVGLGGVQVVLVDSNGNVVASTATASNGSYFFDEVPAGSYTVREADPSGYGSTTPNVVPISVVPNETTTVDFGDLPIGQVSGVVFNDIDGDGIQDPAEPGLAGVTVRLFDANGNVVGSTTTNALGGYLFSSVPAGSYDVVETDPSGYASTTANRVPVNVPVNGAAVANFGDQQQGTISGIVFVDRSGNGSQEPNETGLAGVTVRLLDANGSVIATAVTGPNGGYQFNGLSAGNYTVVESDPAGYVSTSPNSVPVILPAGGAGNANFGEQPVGTVSGTVFNDLDGDGINDPREPGLVGVAIELVDSNGNVVATGTTGPDGSYVFTNVPPGPYTVVEEDPSGFSSTTSNQVPVNVAPGGAASASFGDRQAGTISGVAFEDTDGDGVQDDGERGLSGVTVTLRDGSGNVVATARTSADGTYVFSNLPAGSYSVVETDPSGYMSTSPNTVAVTLPAGGSGSANFGDKPIGTVSGVVFEDANRDGVQNPNEDGIRNVTVELVSASGTVVATTTTASDGSYQFVDVAPGNYTVRETDPAGYSSTTPNTVSVAVAVGGSGTANFGDQPIGTISGSVYDDRDSDGRQDPDEPGIGGVAITIRDGNGNVVATTTTRPDGSYSVEGLPPGSYTVVETDPSGYTSTTPNSVPVTLTGSNGGSASFGDRSNNAAPGTPTPTPVPGAAPDLTLVKAHVGSFQSGSNGQYTLTVTNQGGGATTGPITLTDNLPAGLTFVSAFGTGWSCSAGGQAVTCSRSQSLASRASTSVTLTVAVGDAAIPTVTNTAAVATAGDSNTGNNQAQDPTTVRAGVGPTNTPTPTATSGPGGTATATPTPIPGIPDLWLQMSQLDDFQVGRDGRYRLTITNVGAGSTTGLITVTDVLPSGLTFVSASGSGWDCSAVGQVVTCTSTRVMNPGDRSLIDLTVAVGDAAFPTVTNSASVTTPGDPVQGNNADSHPTTIYARDVVIPTRTATPTSAVPTATPPYLDIALVKNNVGNFRTCQVGVYDFWVYNQGTGSRGPTAGTITITDQLPAGLTYLSSEGDYWTCSATESQLVTCTRDEPLPRDTNTVVHVSVMVGEEAYPTINNVAYVSTPFDGNPQNNVESEQTTVYRGNCAASTPTAPPAATATPAAGTPSAATPTPTPGDGITGGQLVVRGPRYAVPGYSVVIKAKARQIRGPLTLEMEMPEGLTAFQTTPPATFAAGNRLVWLYPDTGVPLSQIVTVKATVDSSVPPGAVLSTMAMAHAPAGYLTSAWSMTTRGSTTSGSTRVASLTGSTVRAVVPGLQTAIRLRVKDLVAGPGRLELQLPPGLRQVVLSTPQARDEGDGRFVWPNVPAPGASLSLRVVPDASLGSGVELPISATLTDANGSTTTTTFSTVTR